MAKTTVASLECRLVAQAAEIAALSKRIERFEAQVERTQSQISHSLPKGYEKLSGEAKARADASLARRAALRH